MILITAPHSFCEPSEKRMCDKLAHKAAIYLYRNFDNSRLILSDKPRYEIDFNRKESRDTKFRKIVKYLNHSGSISLLLDIHSFPPTDSSFKEEIVLLPLKYVNSHSQNLSEFLKKRGITVQIFVGSFKNDITLKTNEVGIPNMLIEFRENLTDKRLNYITKAISSFYKNDTL